MPKPLLVVPFFVQYYGPTDNWPEGSYSLYQISSDEIAKRVQFDENGVARGRDSWPGYVDTFASLSALTAAMGQKIVAAKP